ncbi:unnamed protein product [Rotaria sp. Silwood1]|nr:unnamed protein product [Rotaria sp. Silwood1]
MNQSENTSVTSLESMLDRYIKLYLLATISIPSILTSIYILYKFVIDRQFRSHINNHTIIAMIIVSFVNTTTELSITLQYLRVDYVQPNKKNFCVFWIWYVFALQIVNISLMTWALIE